MAGANQLAMLSDKELARPQPAGFDSIRRKPGSLSRWNRAFNNEHRQLTVITSSQTSHPRFPFISKVAFPPTVSRGSVYLLRIGLLPNPTGSTMRSPTLALLLIAFAALSQAQSPKNAQQKAGAKNPFTRMEKQVHSSMNDLNKPYSHMFKSAVSWTLPGEANPSKLSKSANCLFENVSNGFDS